MLDGRRIRPARIDDLPLHQNLINVDMLIIGLRRHSIAPSEQCGSPTVICAFAHVRV